VGTEIERKFLVVDDAWRSAASRTRRMVQGYLVDAKMVTSGAARSSVRIRIDGEVAMINIKSSTLGVERDEYEYPIPYADGEKMLATLCDGVVEKIRHYVAYAGHEFEVDEFLGDNDGLVIAELELDAVDAEFERPAWLGREVTDARYYNLNLVKHPYARWSAAEKEGH